MGLSVGDVMNDRFTEIMQGLIDLHIKKAADYGSDNDQYANVRASREFGIEPWVGAVLRMNDKVQRLKSMVKKGRLVNESILDSFDDIAVYAVIARVLYEEQQEAVPVTAEPSWPDYIGEHARGNHDGIDVFSCPTCTDIGEQARREALGL